MKTALYIGGLIAVGFAGAVALAHYAPTWAAKFKLAKTA